MENLAKAAAGDPGAVAGVAAGWDYALELLRRAALAPGWAREGQGGPPELVRYDFAGLRALADSCNKTIKTACKAANKANNSRYLHGETEAVLDDWLAGIRDDACRQWSVQGAVATADNGEGDRDGDGNGDGDGDAGSLVETLELIGSKVPAEAVDLLVASGSSMYNLATGSSDIDYFVVFTNETRRMLDRSPPVTSFEAHVAAPIGANKAGEIECNGRELGSYLVDLAKGNPQVVELLFMPVSRSLHESTSFAELRSHRLEFITQRCVDQYLGFISDRLHKARRLLEQHTTDGSALRAEHEDAVAKLLYHAFHKLFDLQRIVSYGEFRCCF